MNLLWTILLGLINAVVVGVLVRRVITVGTGWVRNTVVSLVIGLSLWPITLQAFSILGITDHGAVPWVGLGFQAAMVFLLLYGWFIVVQMFVLLAIELVVPSGSFTTVARSASRLPTWYRRVRRLIQIQRILLKFGLGRYLRPRLPSLRLNRREIAKTTAEAFAAAGVTFVKLGQFIATRADMVPIEFVEEFSKLQSEVPPVPFAQLEPELVRAWGRPVDEVFAEFDTVPLAAASVAQVHRAVMFDGAEVVVKVQRPKLRRQVRADSDIVLTLAQQVERRAGWARKVGIVKLAAAFVDSLAAELDYRGEAAQTIALRRADIAHDDSLVRIPEVYTELSGPTVLVLERIEGVPLARAGTRLDRLSALARRDLAEQLFEIVARQVLTTGIFHADLHAGNIIIDGGGRAGLIDFGAVGRLDKRDRRDVAILLVAFEQQNSQAATSAVLDMLGAPVGVDVRELQRDVGQIMMQFQTAPGGYSALFSQLIEFFVDHGFAMPSTIATAFRAISTLEGSLKLLDPQLDLLDLVRAHGEGLLAETRSMSGAIEDAKLYAATTAPLFAEFPARVSRVVQHLEDGTLDIGTSGLGLDSIKELVRSLVDSLVQVVLSTALILGGVVMMAANFGPQLTSELKLFTYFGGWILLGGCTLAAIVLAPSLKNRSL
ncbi:phosphotransferase [Brevibacterium sp. 5221]|uniref:Phosphotransferase n=1 Tax=Brevibacterium rongguiense TaxID=2695267 RepID=A0A6N9H5V5_9MICO|nr:AarF/UbiB family protein [Brevibacterium rongguiense]MYM19460.1 phosphotransferase [Brevibacterium rongguiense]